MSAIKAVVFDLGGVLVDWNPRHLYRKIFATEDEMEEFLSSVATMAWNEQLDRGVPFDHAVADLTAKFPDHATNIAAYIERWTEMIAGPIDDGVEVLAAVKAAGLPVYALSNWSEQTFLLVRDQFGFLDCFDGILLSSQVGVTKPDTRIFAELCRRFELDPATTLFVDDSALNVHGAQAAGLQAVLFTSGATLREHLRGLGVLGPATLARPMAELSRRKSARNSSSGNDTLSYPEQVRVVRRYLSTLDALRPGRGPKRAADAIANRLLKIDELLISADPIERLHLTQERIDLDAEAIRLGSGNGDIDISDLEAEFVKVAKPYGERCGVTFSAWRQVGVEADVLEKAGIVRARKSAPPPSQPELKLDAPAAEPVKKAAPAKKKAPAKKIAAAKKS